ncbi:MAG TPA: SbcC/MukB-like Walker B domain-containing protein, partial [Stackebrandtia sp.]|uniref:SbcC/MukB-like Walker B domain-containing protein n=1 Tax=Stackebrandtia sp. TaxID=2023065 RepID=UPI002D50005B
GQKCPVCTQEVSSEPPRGDTGALSAAHDRLREARAALAESEAHLRKSQDIALDYRARLDTRIDEQAAVAKALADAPSPERLRADREAAREAQRALTEASTRVRTTRDALRRNESNHAKLAEQQSGEWRKFDHHRDRVAALAPPAVDRDDLAAAWRALAEWAGTELGARAARRREHERTESTLESEVRKVRDALVARLAEIDVHVPGTSGGSDFVEAAVRATAQSEDAHRKLLEQRDLYVKLTADRGERARAAQVAKQLHEHLGTRRFVNWLLSEALDELVIGASEILCALTSGQYDLTYADNDFYVIDHHDADLTRPVRTLSGGETFAASLSLALAMSDQLAGMSSRGASLEAILLDEGFGTLDAATLDQVASSLESLAGNRDRMVGVVTHVASLAERVPVRFEVGKDARGSHVARMEG